MVYIGFGNVRLEFSAATSAEHSKLSYKFCEEFTQFFGTISTKYVFTNPWNILVLATLGLSGSVCSVTNIHH